MRERGSIKWMLPPRGWKMNREQNQRLTMLWHLPGTVIYEPKPKGHYDLLVPTGPNYRVVEMVPGEIERESNWRNWGRVYIGHKVPVSVMEYNAITITEWGI